ncbi:hypothetical protein GH714_018777 [Hevea brasiliensis]|uniref:acyl-CoA oxidase n=1 Tax=Hevea brasiliensis TaxID=3981 RepID=A0A6A6K9C7_HEVBR|nr:hypothetical protein GH714_018777 [Hevea brasiliensis]
MDPENPNWTADDETQIVSRRIQRLSFHLIPIPRPLYESHQLGMVACARAKLEVDTEKLSFYMRGNHREIQGREAGIRPFRYVVEDPAKYFAIAEAVGAVDMSLGIKLGVQYRNLIKYYALFEIEGDIFISLTVIHGKFATVFAKLMLPTDDSKGVSDMGVHAFIVPIRDLKTHQTLPGIEIHDCGHKYTSSLPTINKRFAATLGELVGGRVGLAYSSVGVLKLAGTIAIRYSLLRQQFGPPKQPEVSILDYQSQQHKLMPMLASTYAFHFATLHLVAGDLLKQYKEKFQGGTLAVTWNYLKESMNAYLSQPNPVTARWEGVEHLRDPKFQLDAFRHRTSRLLQSVAVRLHKHSKTLGGFGAWNRCLNHLLTLAESHIESVILAKFIEAVQNCPDVSSRAALKLACDLYALDRIWNDIGTYRNVDYVAPNKAKAIHKLTEYLSFEVRNIARELVDAFDLPDRVTRAPIAMQSEAYAQYTQHVGF